MISSSTTLDVVGAAFGLYVLNRFLRSRSTHSLPPGPRGLPLIGNILDWPKEKEWETFTAWRELYGDIVYCNLFGQPAIVIGNPQIALEMLDRKSAIYSERPVMWFAFELVGWKGGPVAAPYGKRLKVMRAYLNKAIGSKTTAAKHAPKVVRSAAWLAVNLIARPEKLEELIRRAVGKTILQMSHGYIATDGLEPDPFVELAERALAVMSESLRPGAYLVDVLPWLRFVPAWVPGAGFQRTAARMRKTVEEFLIRPHDWVKEQLTAGTAQSSFVADELASRTLTPYEDDALAWAAAAFYGAGTDTTSSAIHTLFLAMTLHPEAQALAQAEIDTVVGTDRLPEIGDRDTLSYVNAICLEVLRWGWVVPQGIPHASKEADVHAGYLIPKGTIVVQNIWGFTHDSRMYQDPFSFHPERFILGEGREPERDPRDFVFGFGRRICPGAALADSHFFVVTAVILAALKIKPKFDELGNIIRPEVEFSSGMITHAYPFACSISARSEKAEELVSRAALDI